MCVSMRAVYLVLLNLSFLRMSVCVCIRSVARKETVDVHQKNWVCLMYCQINAKK